MIEFDNVDVTYRGGFKALKGVSLTIEPGELVVIVGLSGAGKSTGGMVVITKSGTTAGPNPCPYAAGTTLTLDNTAPAAATWVTITPGDGQVDLSWNNPGDADFAETIVVRTTALPFDFVPVDGSTYTFNEVVVAK